jgi:hypothetical protein
MKTRGELYGLENRLKVLVGYDRPELVVTESANYYAAYENKRRAKEAFLLL